MTRWMGYMIELEWVIGEIPHQLQVGSHEVTSSYHATKSRLNPFGPIAWFTVFWLPKTCMSNEGFWTQNRAKSYDGQPTNNCGIYLKSTRMSNRKKKWHVSSHVCAEMIQKPLGRFPVGVPRSLRGKSRWVSRPGPWENMAVPIGPKAGGPIWSNWSMITFLLFLFNQIQWRDFFGNFRCVAHFQRLYKMISEYHRTKWRSIGKIIELCGILLPCGWLQRGIMIFIGWSQWSSKISSAYHK